jgi:hypothetical protein
VHSGAGGRYAAGALSHACIFARAKLTALSNFRSFDE